MKNILLTIEYDGSGFHGWQRQQGDRTVQGELEKALSQTMGKDIRVAGTSRTDAGVHALGQRAGFQCDTNVPVEKLPMILNNKLAKGRIFNQRIPGEIKIKDAKEVPADFHARFNAVGKTYIYKIICAENQDLFKRNYYYQLKPPLNIEAMKKASEYIVGTHDFKSFETTGGTVRESTVRTVYGLNITNGFDSDSKEQINIEITGDGFLYNMVRIITGTLVEVGLNKRIPDSIKDVVSSCNRENAGHTAPPSGLYLEEVYYSEEVMNRKVQR